MNAFSHLRLFDACVKPIRLYCSEIWSLDILIKRNLIFESKYDSFVPNKTQMKFAKFVLGGQQQILQYYRNLGYSPFHCVL